MQEWAFEHKCTDRTPISLYTLIVTLSTVCATWHCQKYICALLWFVYFVSFFFNSEFYSYESNVHKDVNFNSQDHLYLIAGVDVLLAQHLAHLFIRDPISVFSEKIDQNDEEDTDHFEVHLCTDNVLSSLP